MTIINLHAVVSCTLEQSYILSPSYTEWFVNQYILIAFIVRILLHFQSMYSLF